LRDFQRKIKKAIDNDKNLCYLILACENVKQVEYPLSPYGNRACKC